MNIFILHDNQSIDTATDLGIKFKEILQEKIKVSIGDSKRLEKLFKKNFKVNFILNTANKIDSKCLTLLTKIKQKVINLINLEGVITSSVKTFIKLKLNGMNTPAFWLSKEDIQAFPVVAHKTDKTKKVCNTLQDLSNIPDALCTHYTKYYRASESKLFRVYLIAKEVSSHSKDYRILKIDKKIVSIDKHYKIRTDFKSLKANEEQTILTNTLKVQAKKAMQLMGLHYGYVEMVVPSVTSKILITDVSFLIDIKNLSKESAKGFIWAAYMMLNKSRLKRYKRYKVPKNFLSNKKNATLPGKTLKVLSFQLNKLKMNSRG